MRGPVGRACGRKAAGEDFRTRRAEAAGLVTPFSLPGYPGEASYREALFVRAMAGPRGKRSKGKGDAEKQVSALRRELRSVDRRLCVQEKRLKEMGRLADLADCRQTVLLEALQLGETPKRGDRGVIRELQDSTVRLEDYLLKTAERIENILTALKQHRELLVTVNKRLLDVGTKDRIRLELDVMKNTLSILSLNGVEYDASLVKEIDALRARVRQSEDLAQLERAKADLDKKFGGELKKFDLGAIWTKRKEIPGYR